MSFRRAGLVAVGLILLLGTLRIWRTGTPSPSEHGLASPLGGLGVAASALASAATQSDSVNLIPDQAEARSTSRTNSPPWAPSISEPRFARFAQWTDRYIQASPAEKQSLEVEGIALAQARREEMADLIQSNPKQALEWSVPFGVRRQMPSSVASLLEEPLSARGTLAVVAALPAPGRESEIAPLWHTAAIGGGIYRAFVYGRRLAEPTRENVPFHGVALDDLLAVHEDPARVLTSEEAAFRKAQAAGNDPVCTVSGLPSASQGDETAIEVADETLFLCSLLHAAQYNEELIAAESGASDDTASLAPLAASAWTEGTKALILIRVDFDDLEGEPFDDAAGVKVVEGLDRFYREMSYGKTGFELVDQGSAVTPTFRMSRTAAYYGSQDASVLRRDARAAATAEGYTLSDYNLDVICCGAVPGFKFSGLGYVGSAGAWIRDSSSVGVFAHELGHNFGLNHANFWDTAGQSVIGPGTTVEYGDKFDTMGSANAGSKHFNTRYKSQLNWLTGADVRTATESGTYRIFAHDNPDATGLRALKIAKNSTTNYWVEYRARYAGNKWLPFGAGLRWGHPASQATRLLDATPGSSAGKDDSCVLIGRTFSDPEAGLHLTPIARSTVPPESIDIVVNKGTFPGNTRPVVQVTASAASAATGAELTFTAAASDVNGDTLAYFWDFGDGSFGENQSANLHGWNATGEYVVQCTVTDMKGGVATGSVVVQIGSPSTFSLSGRVLAEGQPLQGARVSVSSTRLAYTDSDGRYSVVGLTSGSYTIKAVAEGYVFSHPNFVNPVNVGPSRANLDFVAVPPDGQNTISLVAAGSVWQYRDDGSNQGTAWRQLGFDDSLWNEGPAPLGYGDDNEKTVVDFGPNSNSKYVTTYFRRQFTVEDPQRLSALTLSVRRDDGAVVYLNGREVFRSNMPAGSIGYTTLASGTVSTTDETAFFQTEVDPALVRAGANQLAVEVHQGSRSSSDIVFDLELLATTAAAPAPPDLNWELAAGAFQLTWPDGATSWTLYAAPDLTPDVKWTPFKAQISLLNGQRAVAISPGGEQQFYRLGNAH